VACIVHLPIVLLYLLMHLHLTALEPVIRDALVIAKNPVVQKEAKAAAKAVVAYEKQRRAKRQ
jgi:hypothetical protein